jgi:intracellular sulfur oxidation DsrE/DsrF family protein
VTVVQVTALAGLASACFQHGAVTAVIVIAKRGASGQKIKSFHCPVCRLKGTGVESFACHPGMARTGEKSKPLAAEIQWASAGNTSELTFKLR